MNRGVDRSEALQALHGHLTDELVVAALGNAAYDLFNAGDRDEHFYMWGAMGLGISVGLGVAMTVPDARVIALDGDGAALMNLGTLATVGTLAPPNLTAIIFDNRSYDLTGAQPTATEYGADLAAVARACGIARVEQVETQQDFESLIPRMLDEDGPWCIVVETLPTSPDRKKPLVALRRRFVRTEEFTDTAIAVSRGGAS